MSSALLRFHFVDGSMPASNLAVETCGWPLYLVRGVGGFLGPRVIFKSLHRSTRVAKASNQAAKSSTLSCANVGQSCAGTAMFRPVIVVAISAARQYSETVSSIARVGWAARSAAMTTA